MNKSTNAFIGFIFIILFPGLLFAQIKHNEYSFDQDPDYLKVAESYATIMIKDGRDTYGTDHTPLFASALSRISLNPGSVEEFGSIPGIRETDRTIGGANPLNDVALYDLLYKLTEVTGNDIFASEANRALDFFFSNCQSPVTGLMCWGEHLHWDFSSESCVSPHNHEYHEAAEWPFWDRCYRLEPEACWNFVIGEWDHQISDQTTGDFSRHARWSVHGPNTGMDFPRYAGQMIERWADAYARKENKHKPRREELITAITTLLERMKENMNTPSGYLAAFRGADYLWPASNLELSRCLWEAAPEMKSSLVEQMQKFALQLDEDFLNAPHQLDSGGGFAVTLNAITGEPRSRSMNKPYTIKWSTGYGFGTHASTANLCYRRYHQLKDNYPDMASAYSKLILAAADQYLVTLPVTSELIQPESFSNAIDLLLNNYKLTDNEDYLEQADELAKLGIKLFLPEGFPLPRASNKHDHYESLTGGPDFINSLLNLHLTQNVLKSGHLIIN